MLMCQVFQRMHWLDRSLLHLLWNMHWRHLFWFYEFHLLCRQTISLLPILHILCECSSHVLVLIHLLWTLGQLLYSSLSTSITLQCFILSSQLLVCLLFVLQSFYDSKYHLFHNQKDYKSSVLFSNYFLLYLLLVDNVGMERRGNLLAQQSKLRRRWSNSWDIKFGVCSSHVLLYGMDTLLWISHNLAANSLGSWCSFWMWPTNEIVGILNRLWSHN